MSRYPKRKMSQYQILDSLFTGSDSGDEKLQSILLAKYLMIYEVSFPIKSYILIELNSENDHKQTFNIFTIFLIYSIDSIY